MKIYMLDTNVFSYIDESQDDITCSIGSCEFVYTRVQESELQDNPNTEERYRRLRLLRSVCGRKIPVETDAWMDSLRWDDDGIWSEEPDTVADRVSKGSYSRKKRHDAMILAATKRIGCILVTNDSNLRAKARSEGVVALSAIEMLEHMRESVEKENL
ncbi:PIN domain-containing protein [Granulosicoccus antarcticus]|uniref:PIN domain-containing protein n=1 Tax=Granulosicoccus antarcticus IMCC3135 TaxID=1192854 RepID=A0A2Z2P0B5_9GAMM|nr:PIN domain-containing protein [Granulosicoccus antarcticus]ASJ76205.1 hypothetical protein IMCC3135_30780 [Granulosicoccus antarcticus IMCC3135]